MGIVLIILAGVSGALNILLTLGLLGTCIYLCCDKCKSKKNITITNNITDKQTINNVIEPKESIIINEITERTPLIKTKSSKDIKINRERIQKPNLFKIRRIIPIGQIGIRKVNKKNSTESLDSLTSEDSLEAYTSNDEHEFAKIKIVPQKNPINSINFDKISQDIDFSYSGKPKCINM